METLITDMLQGGNPLTVGVGIVIEVIRKNNSDYDPENVGGPDSIPTTYDPIYLGTLLRLFADRIPDFMNLILSSKHNVIDENGKVHAVERGQLNSAWGAKIEPLGFDRFKTCELMAELLHCSNMGLLNEPGSEDFVRQRDAERERLVSSAPEQGEASQTEEQAKSPADDNTGNAEAEGSSLNVPDEEREMKKDIIKEESETRNSSPPLSDQLGKTNLDGDNKPSEEQNTNQASSSSNDLPLLSPHPEDVPAPLSAAAQETASTTSNAAAAAAAGEEAGESSSSSEKKEDHPVPVDVLARQCIQSDVDGRPVVGDYLKTMFVDHRVVPSILVSFFSFLSFFLSFFLLFLSSPHV